MYYLYLNPILKFGFGYLEPNVVTGGVEKLLWLIQLSELSINRTPLLSTGKYHTLCTICSPPIWRDCNNPFLVQSTKSTNQFSSFFRLDTHFLLYSLLENSFGIGYQNQILLLTMVEKPLGNAKKGTPVAYQIRQLLLLYVFAYYAYLCGSSH